MKLDVIFVFRTINSIELQEAHFLYFNFNGNQGVEIHLNSCKVCQMAFRIQGEIRVLLEKWLLMSNFTALKKPGGNAILLLLLMRND